MEYRMDRRAAKQKRVSMKFIFLFLIGIALFTIASVLFFMEYDRSQKVLSNIDATKYEATIEPDDVWKNDTELFGKSLTELNELPSSEYFFYTPSGIKIVSNSDKWGLSQLKDVYKELLRNTHGKEMGYLMKIVLEPKGFDEDKTDIAGLYEPEEKSIDFGIAFNALFANRYISLGDAKFGNIYLYHMDEAEEIKEIARTLSHEYGHHYTHHYFFTGENEDRGRSDYYQLRGLSEFEDAKSYDDWDEYIKMHAWDIDEMAAEDYVQLLGSPTNKQIGEYMDVKEALYSDNKEWVGSTEAYHYNVFAQENPVIPMAEQVEGLEAYFYSFIDEGYIEGYDEYGSIVIESKRKRAYGKTHYELTWNALELPFNSEVIYTMVCFNKDGSLYSGIKTVSGDEELKAVVGTPTRKSGNWIYWWDDTTMEEDRIFRVFAYIVCEDIMIGSEPFYADF